MIMPMVQIPMNSASSFGFTALRSIIKDGNTGKVTGAFELDFDKREFSAVNIMDGWKTFAMGDVSAAAYHAFRKEGLSVDP